MSTIRVVYDYQPEFPATDQHPDAVRYTVGSYWVDAIGGEPSIGEVNAFLFGRPAPDLQPWQFRAMLKLSGKEADLLAFLDQIPEPAQTVAKAKLEYTLVFRRDNDLVLAAQQALGLTDQELDGLWNQAASL